MKKVIDRGKRRKTLSEVKPVKNIRKNLQSILRISLLQKEVLLQHKLQDHAYEYQNPFGLKEDNLSQKNCQNQLSHPGLSQSTKFERRPQIFVKLSFRVLCNSKLSGLHTFDNMVIIKLKLVKNRKVGYEFMRHQSLK